MPTKDTSGVSCLRRALTDSLQRLVHPDNFVYRDTDDRFVMYSTEVNGRNIGLIAITDIMFYFFQDKGNGLTMTDSGVYDDYAFSFETEDLNGDGKDDFIVSGHSDMHGQSRTSIFVSDSTGLLHYIDDIHLCNIHYNPNTHLVQSYYESCAFCVHSKSQYQWINDSLVEVARAEMDLTSDKKITVTLLRRKNRKMYQVKKLSGNSDRISEFYDTVLFKLY